MSGDGAPPRLSIRDETRPGVDAGFVGRVVDAACAEGGRADLNVSLLLTGNAEIARLHEAYLGDPSPTDVLSFPADDVADIVVSVERAHDEARARGHDWRAELALYIAHGILHLCGHDDRDADDRARMRDAERRVLDALDLRVSAVDE